MVLVVVPAGATVRILVSGMIVSVLAGAVVDVVVAGVVVPGVEVEVLAPVVEVVSAGGSSAHAGPSPATRATTSTATIAATPAPCLRLPAIDRVSAIGGG
jgi:hypothetical protein